jgi:hypothetical protein
MDQAMKKSDLWLPAEVPEISEFYSFLGIGRVTAWINFTDRRRSERIDLAFILKINWISKILFSSLLMMSIMATEFFET